MEQINQLELCNPNIYPDDSVFNEVLGDSYSTYCALLDIFKQHELTHDWRYYNDGKAWLCKVQKKQRTIIWMSAWNGFMQATIYFPEKYLEAFYALAISDETKQRIRETKNVGKSKPCTFDIRTQSDLTELTTVMQFKIALK